ncbi:MAG: PAS domain S-box protein, partial [Longimicrobiales bacterium]
MRTRVVVYAATAAVLAVTAAVMRAADWRTNAGVHALQETAAILLAALVGTLSLVRYYSRKERLFLVIGAAFLGTAILDGYHAVVTFLAPAEENAGVLVFSPWSWIASRTFLGLFLLRLAFVRHDDKAHSPTAVHEGVIFGIAAVLVLAALIALTFVPLPPPYRAGLPLPRPQELVPATLFLIALLVNLRQGGWKHNVFEHWLVVALIVGFAGEAFFMASSAALYDSWFDAGHLLKTVSYACVLIGLLMSVFFTYRRLQENQQALATANVALEREIAEREAAEQELLIRTAYLEQLLESAPEAIVVVDESDRILRVNAEFTTIFGYTPANAVGRRVVDLIVQPAAARESDAVNRAVASGLTVSYETARRRKDGTLVDVSILSTPIRGAGGHVAVYGIYRDITDRKRAEQARRESADRLEAMVRASPLGIIIVDPDEKVRLWNPAAERILGVRAAEAMRHPLPLLDRNTTAGPALRDALDGDPLSDREVEWRRPGAADVVSVSTAPLSDASGERTGTLLVVTDATRRREADIVMREGKAAAEAANRSKSEFLASMSHELRTPLNSVIGFTRVLLRNKGRNLRPMDVAYLERIAANGEHLLGLINDILDLSRIEAGRLQLDLTTTDLEPLIAETIARLKPRVHSGVRLCADVPEPLAPVTTDQRRLKQVLINLITNALKFTSHGSVCVAVAADAVTRVPERIDVSDTGIGIPEDRLGLIFEAFEQADGGTARRYGGTGLGLSISRGLCARMGYRLTVCSAIGS